MKLRPQSLVLAAPFLIVVAPTFAPSLAAQIIIQQGGGFTFSVDDDDDMDGMFPAAMLAQLAGGAVPAASGAKGGARIERLKALEFDRRPSAILAAWSTPLPPLPGDDVAAASAVTTAPADAGAVALDPSDPATATPTPVASARNPVTDEGVESAAVSEADAEAAAAAVEAKAAAAAAAAAEAAALEREILVFQRNVTLGDWDAVRTYLVGLEDDVHAAAYQQLLTSLQRGPSQRPQVMPQGMPYLERNRVAPGDVVALAAMAPRGEDGAIALQELNLLGQLLTQAFDAGHQIESFLGAYRPLLGSDPTDPLLAPLSARELARVLVAADRPLYLDGLLPSAADATAAGDRDALNLIARHALARHGDDGKTAWLEAAWGVTLAALGVDESEGDRLAVQEALTRAVDLAPKLRADLGQAWLETSFTSRPERGMQILAAIGTATAQSLASAPMQPDARLRLLGLQSTSANALLAAAPERASEWGAQLDLLAGNWLREATVTQQLDTSTQRGPGMQRDPYGNVFYFDGGFNMGGNQAQPIPTGKVLELRPGDDWLKSVSPTLRPRLAMVTAQLLLKVSEEEEAFPHIEQVAVSDPRSAQILVDEFLRVWAKNNNPNEMGRRANQYVFFFGFEERASGIPLTRSKQERNLTALAGWVERLRALPVEVDDKLVVDCFRAAHSTAEVYRVETLERIFGSLAALEPATLASLMQQMRQNLATIWRDPAEQESAGTNRRQKDIQAEVLRGYEIARATIDRARSEHGASWELALASAALAHDENNFRHTIGRDGEFTARRAAAFVDFARAAQLYAAVVPEMERDDESVDVYDTWFQAALGACDLKAIAPEHVLATTEVENVRAALQGLPGASAQRHVDRIASQLFAKMSALNPGVKFRFVRAALALVGEHDLAREARDLYDYYADLVTEIELKTSIDGSAKVGQGQSFGLVVNLVHTAAIERESGGFSKYLANQNAANFGFNYGRPTEDYRDRFETAARATLGSHFKVHSVTFNDPKAHSVADARYGWRITPYAYILLEPLGHEVDAVPSLRLDMDFLDTSGYAVLPVESAVLPLDAAAEVGDPRPFEALDLTLMLDERQAVSGRLLVEVKATSVGVPPAAADLLDLASPGFVLGGVTDNGPSVVQFDPEGRGVLVERTMTLEYKGPEGAKELPDTFAFPAPKVEVTQATYLRYADADLVSAAPIVDLEQRYGAVKRPWLLWALAALVAVAAGFYLLRRRAPKAAPDADPFGLPDRLTPFTLLGYLRTLHARNGLDAAGRGELEREIAALERRFFADGAEGPADLEVVARRWSVRAL